MPDPTTRALLTVELLLFQPPGRDRGAVRRVAVGCPMSDARDDSPRGRITPRTKHIAIVAGQTRSPGHVLSSPSTRASGADRRDFFSSPGLTGFQRRLVGVLADRSSDATVTWAICLPPPHGATALVALCARGRCTDIYGDLQT